MSGTPCADCGIDTQDPKHCEYWYMVRDEVWQDAGSVNGFLCVEHLEARLGRHLTALDFAPDLPINEPLPWDTERLATRKANWPENAQRPDPKNRSAALDATVAQYRRRSADCRGMS